MHAVSRALTLISRSRRRVRSLSEAVLLVKVGVVMSILPLVARLETRAMLRLLERLGWLIGVTPTQAPERVVAAVRSFGGIHRWGFQDNCVAQSLTLFTLLNQADAPLDVVFGVEQLATADGVPHLGRRHVWLSRDGMAVHERESLDLTKYAVQTRYRAMPRSAGGGATARLLAVLGFSSAGSAATSVASVARTKIVAVALGAPGIGIAGQVSQAMLGLTWLATFGAAAGTTRHLAEAVSRNDDARAARVVATAAWVLSAVALALSCVAIAGAKSVASMLFGDPGTVRWVYWLVPAIPAAALLSLCTSLLRGTGQAQRLAIAQAVGACLAIVASLLLVRGGTLDTLAPLALVITTAQAATLLIAARPLLERWLFRGATFSTTIAREVVGYGMANVVMGLATAASALFIGRHYLSAGATTEAGRIAAIAWFGEPLSSVLVSGLFASTFPAYCAASTEDAEAVLSRAVRALVLLITPPLCVVALVAGPLLGLLFSHAFVSLAPLLALQAFATYLRCANVLLGIPLLARGRVWLLTALHLLWAAAVTSGAMMFSGVHGYVLALFAGSLLHLLLLVTTLRASRLSPVWGDYGWLLGAAAVLALAIVV